MKFYKTVIVLSSLLVVCFAFATVGAQNEESFKIVVNPANNLESLTKSEASKIFLKKVTKWDNGTVVYPVDLSEQSDVRQELSQKIHGKSVTAVKSYWQQMIFSGRAVPPPEKMSETEVLEYIRSNPNAIGYVSADAPTNGVKEVTVTY